MGDKEAYDAFQYLDTQTTGCLHEKEFGELIDGLLGPMYKCKERTAVSASFAPPSTNLPETLDFIVPGDHVVGLGEPQQDSNLTWRLKVKANAKVGWITLKTSPEGPEVLQEISDPDMIFKNLDEHFKKARGSTQDVPVTAAKRRHKEEEEMESKSRRVDLTSLSSSDEQEKQKHLSRMNSQVLLEWPWEEGITRQHIKSGCEKFGPVEQVKMTRNWHDSELAFVTFTNPESAKKCLAEKNIYVIDHVLAKVKKIWPRLWVGDLKQGIGKEVLRKHFVEFGEIHDVRIGPGDDHALLFYRSLEDAATVLGKRTQTINGTTVRILDYDNEEIPNRAVQTGASAYEQTGKHGKGDSSGAPKGKGDWQNQTFPPKGKGPKGDLPNSSLPSKGKSPRNSSLPSKGKGPNWEWSSASLPAKGKGKSWY